MLEILRRKVKTRLVSMREVAEKYPAPLFPRIQKFMWPVYVGNEKYEVNYGLGLMQWEHVRDMKLILPPMIRRPSGRPKQTKRKEVDEARKMDQN
ncbi:Glutamyl aminopeptidase [Gossypium arboreum]|uniref:Glutamyl aminopeptidase n=1 Tax=Gossypium arboreum TaxID=29729 RepID=A0A0B0PS72_GOSAR|nr:Glutamyl aminopeptidase [Gossypium arboreum]